MMGRELSPRGTRVDGEAAVEGQMDSPLGRLLLRAGRGGLTHLLYEDAARGRPFGAGRVRVLGCGPATGAAVGTAAAATAAGAAAGAVAAEAILMEAVEQLRQYFAGAREVFEVPLLPGGTRFQRDVWNSLRRIPFGATQTYGDVAARIGRPKAGRAVGAANRANPIAILLPCHRVIGAAGRLTGYAGGLEAKCWLLRHEGLPVVGDRIRRPDA
jgi:methylated-DNA-[protein]-cysteine S-methyltransferase